MLMDIFLQKNGWEIVVIEEKAYSMVMELADGKPSKSHLAQWLREHASRLGR